MRKNFQLNINETKGEKIINEENIKIKNMKNNFFNFFMFNITCDNKKIIL